MTRARFLTLAAVTLGLAVVLHVAIVEILPTAITSVFMARVRNNAGANHVIASPLPTDKARAVVKPSPDLLYAACVFDASAGPVRVSITPPETYWSLSLFAANSDNFFKLNANDLQGREALVMVALAKDADKARSDFPTATVVTTPGASGVMLARILVLDQADMASQLAAQKSVRCAPATDRS